MSNLFDTPTTVASHDDTTTGGDAIAFLLWVLAFAILAIAPAAVIAAWRWFL